MFGAERVTVAPRLDDALEVAVGLAEGEGVGTPGVLVSGSVVLVGEARSLLVTERANDGGAAAAAAAERRPGRRLGPLGARPRPWFLLGGADRRGAGELDVSR